MDLLLKVVFICFFTLCESAERYETYFEGFPKIVALPDRKLWTSTREYAGKYDLECETDLFDNVPECRIFADMTVCLSTYSACLFKTENDTPKVILLYEKPRNFSEERPSQEKNIVKPFMICKVISLSPKIPKNLINIPNNVRSSVENIYLGENRKYFEYKFRGKTKKTFNFTTDSDSNIQFYCYALGIKEIEDCQWQEVTFYDGETWKLCSSWEKIFKTSKNNVMRVQMSFRIPVAVKCFARTTAVFNEEEIKLKIHRGPYRIENNKIIPFMDKTYTFYNDEQAKISAQCQMLQVEPPCGSNYIEFEDGFDKKTFCKQKIVFISKNGRMKIRIRLDGEGRKFLCIVQAVTGPKANQWDNLKFTNYPMDVATSPQVGTNCDCGRRNVLLKKGRMYGHIGRGEYTWMVSVRDYEDHHRCGGSLITKRHVITAAHCVYKENSTTDFQNTTVVIGSHRSGYYGESQDRQIIMVPKDNIFAHEKFDGLDTLTYDIAVLYLEKEAKFGPKIGPACLPKTYPDMIYREVFMTGWGLTEKQIADNLRLTVMFNVPAELCLLEENMECFFKNDSGSCLGDSGGPLVLYDHEIDRFVQISIVSYGLTPHCVPGITAGTNLTLMHDWIKGIVKKTDTSVQICTKIK